MRMYGSGSSSSSCKFGFLYVRAGRKQIASVTCSFVHRRPYIYHPFQKRTLMTTSTCLQKRARTAVLPAGVIIRKRRASPIDSRHVRVTSRTCEFRRHITHCTAMHAAPRFTTRIRHGTHARRRRRRLRLFTYSLAWVARHSSRTPDGAALSTSPQQPAGGRVRVGDTDGTVWPS